MNAGAAPSFPDWPPGLWRRIVLHPGPGWIGAALEDDVHRFDLRLDHADGRITRASAQSLRTPWSECPGAAGHIARELEGELLADAAARDPAQHCTHLYDLAVLAAAHAGDNAPLTLDMRVADRVDGRTTATLCENGEEKLRWLLDGTMIEGPAPFAGRDLRQLSRWKGELAPRDAERATVLRRAVYISGLRQFVPPADEDATALDGPLRAGVCYNYQMPQAARSRRHRDWRRDFSLSGEEPLAGVDVAARLASLGDNRETGR